ncbi:MAG: TatD family hydrolase [Elusimicrobiota bacterium]
MYIDTHAQLLDTPFDSDRDSVISRAAEKGVDRIIEIGWEPGIWKSTVKLSETRENIFCALGVHPHDAGKAGARELNELRVLLDNPGVKAVGETGLDYYYKNSPVELQKNHFIRHIELAKETGKPLIIHCREAFKDLIGIVSMYYDGSRPAGVSHCFAGSVDEARTMIALGFLIGIDGPVTYPSAKVLKEVVAAIPLEKILLETDCPYLPPQAFRGKRNEPSYLTYIAEEVAKIKNVSVDTVARITTENAVNLFNL